MTKFFKRNIGLPANFVDSVPARTHPNPSLLSKEGLYTLLYSLQNNVILYMSVCYEDCGISSLPLLFAKREGGRGDEFMSLQQQKVTGEMSSS